MKGFKGWNLSILGVNRDPWEFYLMFLSQEIYIELILFEFDNLSFLLVWKYNYHVPITRPEFWRIYYIVEAIIWVSMKVKNARELWGNSGNRTTGIQINYVI